MKSVESLIESMRIRLQSVFEKNPSNQYCIEDTNWKEKDYNGFSGSPVIDFDIDDLKVVPFPIGIITMAAGVTARFLSINVATNIIASFLEKEIADGIIKEL